MTKHHLPLAIDFGPPPRYSQYLIGGSLLCASLLASAWVAWQYYDLNQLLRQSQANWGRAQSLAVRPTATVPAEAQQKLKEELRRAAQVIEQIDAPWDALFEALESAFDERVTLLAVEPDVERQEVRLVAEAKDLPAMIAYLTQVRSLSVLQDAFLTSHQINLQSPQRPVRFTLQAHWKASYAAVTATPAVTSIPEQASHD